MALGAAALALAGAAAAFPNPGTAADVVDSLKALRRPPTLTDGATLEEKQHTMVFVDVSCPRTTETSAAGGCGC